MCCFFAKSKYILLLHPGDLLALSGVSETSVFLRKIPLTARVTLRQPVVPPDDSFGCVNLFL